MRLDHKTICPKCGASFDCGAQMGDQKCWCMQLPVLKQLASAADQTAACLCPVCLDECLRQQHLSAPSQSI